MKLCIS
jgi:hypothetical protein